jgi:two-component system sensor histidine kinase VicK
LSDSKPYSEEKTEAWYGNDIIQEKVLVGYSKIKYGLDGCLDHTQIAMHVTFDAIWNGFLEPKERNIRIRWITEVTSENLVHCKKFMEIVELRHIAGVRGNFGIADKRECLFHAISNEEQPLSHAIITSVKGIVDAQQYLFDTLWSKAIPAEKRIKEFEDGIVPEFMENLPDPDEIHNILKFD